MAPTSWRPFVRRLSRWTLGLLLLSVLAAEPVAQGQATLVPAWLEKVDPTLVETLEHNEGAEFLVILAEQANLAHAQHLESKREKGRAVMEALRATATVTQTPILSWLRETGLEHRSFWITNAILVQGDLTAVRELGSLPSVSRIVANSAMRVQLPQPQTAPLTTAQATELQWNLNMVGAPSAWSLGYRGQGVVIGGQDTGYDWTHPALQTQYRGWNDGAPDHNHNWHDAVDQGGGICGAESPVPCDDHGHGTHTLGTALGSDGGHNLIGVAPEARWIGCRNMDRGVGTPARYMECYQWFVAPTDRSGLNPDPAMAPDIINNSWSCPVSEGCEEPDILRDAVEHVRAAGILSVHSAGNSGWSCGSIDEPAAIYEASLTVGAVSSNGDVASFSSRGPVTVDGSLRRKPDLVAPGVSIRSSWPGDGYAWLSGTSMAAPHVTGVAALLISADPTLAGDVNRLEWLLTRTAAPGASDPCGTSPWPNNTVGYGLVDTVAALPWLDGWQTTYWPIVYISP
ncbi:MAG: S8 family serine peptidase [Candidatus Promineifilaceae bacterium]|nr:S8 family serine peptidase [Candidatus Promineifilaceae bacterium]